MVRKLFEPNAYPKSKTIGLFNRTLDHLKRTGSKQGLCALGFEPNPKHYKRLQEVEANYSRNGWKVHFFPFAVSDKDEIVTFYTDDNSLQEDIGATVFKREDKQRRPYQVKGIRLSSFLITILKGKQIKLAKMDIEGSEYNVLVDMLEYGLLCEEYIKAMFVEFHDPQIGKMRYRSLHLVICWRRSVRRRVTWLRSCSWMMRHTYTTRVVAFLLRVWFCVLLCITYLRHSKKCLLHCYHPQTKFAKAMFSQVSVCPKGGDVHPIACLDTSPGPDTPCGRRPPGSRHLPGADIFPSSRHPLADTPPEQTPPRAVHARRYGQQAGGTHPTGMHTCCLWELTANYSEKYLLGSFYFDGTEKDFSCQSIVFCSFFRT